MASVQHRALRAIQAYRTEQLGGHIERCNVCAAVRYRYHSCRNRHCPKCQSLARERWLAARRAELLPVPYFHVVFTLPHELNALAQGNPQRIYGLLFESASASLIEFGANRRWLGGEIAATLVLHTWGQTLTQHLHLHCLIGAGALSAEGRWLSPRRGFLFPVTALSEVFRGKFLSGLKRLFHLGAFAFAGSNAELAEPAAQRQLIGALYQCPWVAYAKKPFAGPEQVLQYLGRYTHRVAISDERLVSVSDTEVRFRYKDYAHGNRRKLMALAPAEFIRRFLLHVLPRGFMRIRHYGLLANRTKAAKLALARAALGAPTDTPAPVPQSVSELWGRIAGIDIERCPYCAAGRMIPVGLIAPRDHPRIGQPHAP
ncbi:MAG: IS91 family transposase [Betaproteobacteria bacterium]|nr:IS91 family transposase [Betaproteobacteria bacterium]MBI2959371.1 IS91 family transposase [Betaproteobacteria bacterium]